MIRVAKTLELLQQWNDAITYFNLLTALGTVLPKSLIEAFSSNSQLNVREVQAESSPYFTALQYENNLETQRCPKTMLSLGNFNFSKKSLEWFKNYSLIANEPSERRHSDGEAAAEQSRARLGCRQKNSRLSFKKCNLM